MAQPEKLRTKLPKYVHRQRTRHGRVVYYYREPGSRKVRLPDQFGTSEFFAAVSTARRPGPAAPRIEVAAFDRDMTSRVGKVMVAAVRAARTRSRAKGFEFDLTADWALDKAKEQGFLCGVTGIPFFAPNNAGSKVNPFTPSLDRIDCRKGYTRENVRIVVWAINAMLLDWGEDVFVMVSRRYKAWAANR